jgi:TAG lipase/steryl ester hydrolase/phospholipase A2/LPA acyltransferase
MTRLSEMFNVNHFIVSQVNPHVVPFLPKEDGPSNPAEHRSPFVPGWVNTMTHLAKDEILHRITVLSEMGVFPNSMTKAASIMNQKYSGDINIYPELISSNFPRLLENPTKEFMLEACLGGERATWPRLSRIRNACAIELALDRAIQQMRARVAFSPGQLALRLHDSMHHSLNTTEGARRGRFQRRGSHGHELVRRRSRGNSGSQPLQDLRKARSTVSLEQPPFAFSDTVSANRPDALHRRSSISFGGAFTTGSGSDDDEDNEATYTIRPGPPNHRATWEASPYGADSTRGTLHSPARSRRSSFSARSPRSASSRRASPKQVFAPSARDVSMALSPSSRHLLSMTPSVHPDYHEAVASKPRH